MDYQNLYNEICKRGQTQRQLEYAENHHIIPKCMGGSNDKSNLTRLTYKEHYIVHHLLVKIHPTVRGINYAFLCMLRKHHMGRVLTSRQYQTIKEKFSRFKRSYCTIENPGKSVKSRESARDRMLNNNPNQGGATNHTAKAIEVLYEDGTLVHYDYGKQFSELTEISYPTVKALIRHGTGSPKYKIKSITQRE